MKIYWSYEKIPMLASLSSTERNAVIKKINALAMKHWEWWTALFLALVVTGTGAYLGGKGVSGVIGAGIGGGLGSFLHMHAVIYIGQKYYASQMAAPE